MAIVWARKEKGCGYKNGKVLYRTGMISHKARADAWEGVVGPRRGKRRKAKSTRELEDVRGDDKILEGQRQKPL